MFRFDFSAPVTKVSSEEHSKWKVASKRKISKPFIQKRLKQNRFVFILAMKKKKCGKSKQLICILPKFAFFAQDFTQLQNN